MLTLAQVSALLGLPVAAAQRLLAARRVQPAKSPVEKYSLARVVSALEPEELKALRAREHALRMAVRTSKHWLAGFPALVAQWHPTRNVDLYPDEVGAGSTRRVWWKCSAGPDHEWPAQARQRAKAGNGCPFCAGRRVSVTNCIATLAPELASSWHSTRNGKLTPRDLTLNSHRSVWWRCTSGPDHEWRTSPNVRAAGSGCPYCAGQKVSVTNCLATIAPAIAKEWLRAKNGRLDPAKVVAGSPRRAWWRCQAHRSHVWQASIKSRVDNVSGCPFCAGARVTPETSLATRCPDVATEWDLPRNAPLRPEDVRSSSGRLVWWKCRRVATHQWEAKVVDRSRGHGCPFCAGRRVDTLNSLESRFPDLGAQWHPTRNGKLRPSDVTAFSSRRVWWQCPAESHHTWRAIVNNRSHGTGCPLCARRRRVKE